MEQPALFVQDLREFAQSLPQIGVIREWKP